MSVVAVLLGGLTGCAAVGREGQADEVTEAVEALPGVEDVYGDYTNSITTGASYQLRVGLEPNATQAEAAEVARTWTELVGRDGLSGHDLGLHLHTPERADNLTLSAGDGEPLDPTAEIPLWFGLRDELPDLSLSVEKDVRTVALTADDVVGTLSQVRGAAEAHPDLRWSITSPSNLILRFAGVVPDEPTSRWLNSLADDVDMWHVDLTAESVTTRTFLLDERPWTEQIARDHLDLVAALGRPVTHTEAVPDAEDLVIDVGGCRTDGSALQQELNREYGDC